MTFWSTLLEVIRDLLPIVGVLLGFHIFVLKQTIPNRLGLVVGLLCVLFGLTFFLVGLEKAIFPLGEVMAKQLTDPAFLQISPQAGNIHWEDYYWVYIFAASIGFATTVAEPALIAVSMKAEQISGGAISAFGLRIAVAVGVSVGVAVGCFRIVTGTDLWLFIFVAYIAVMIQTLFAPRQIIPLAYDSGGVTTSTVTVPMLAALGIGLATTIPGRNPMVDGFGLIAFASVFPIMTVMGYAQVSEWLASRSNR